MGVRRAPKAIAEKGLLAQAAAANTPWRRNIRLENAKLHLRSLKSIGENLNFYVPFCGNIFGGNRSISCRFAWSAEPEAIDRNRNVCEFPAANCRFGKNFSNRLGTGYVKVRLFGGLKARSDSSFVKPG